MATAVAGYPAAVSALEDVAAAADRVATEQRQVARRARTMQRQRDRGWSWAEILDRDPAPGIFQLVRTSTKRLAAAARLGRTVATGLASEGESRRRIASRVGVTHQRITAMLRSGSHR